MSSLATAKNDLQHLYQKDNKPLPVYDTFRRSEGFVSIVHLDGGKCYSGSPCPTKKEAEKNVALMALRDLHYAADVRALAKPLRKHIATEVDNIDPEMDHIRKLVHHDKRKRSVTRVIEAIVTTEPKLPVNLKKDSHVILYMDTTDQTLISQDLFRQAHEYMLTKCFSSEVDQLTTLTTLTMDLTELMMTLVQRNISHEYTVILVTNCGSMARTVVARLREKHGVKHAVAAPDMSRAMVRLVQLQKDDRIDELLEEISSD